MYPALRLVTPRPGLGTEILDFKPDIVHLVNPALLGISGLHRAREAGVPVVASYHTDLPGYLEKYNLTAFRDFVWNYFRWLHNQADLNLCPTRFIRRQLADHGFERLEIWGRGVDSHVFTPERRSLIALKLTNGHINAPLLLYVGRLAVEKRVEVLRPLLTELPDVRLAIVGDGPERGRLEALFAGTNTVFTGYLRGDDLTAAYAAGDIFVFPGRADLRQRGPGGDGFGIARTGRFAQRPQRTIPSTVGTDSSSSRATAPRTGDAGAVAPGRHGLPRPPGCQCADLRARADLGAESLPA